MTNGQPSAGWYPDHNDASIVRYWDGQHWTEHTAVAQPAVPVPPVGPAGPIPPSAGTGNWFAQHKVASAVLGVVAAFILIGAIGAAAGSSESEPQPTEPVAAAAEADEPVVDEQVADELVDEEHAAEKDAPAEEKAEAEPTEEPAPTEKPTATVEEKFIAIVQKGRDAAESGNEIAVVQARKERGRAICGLLGPSLSVSGWKGTIETVETELGGDSGVMSVAISEDFAVQTWNNSFSDLGSGTLIKPSSKMYGQLADLEEGDEVTFAGRFVPDAGNCVEEQSLMDVNGMLTPDFSFRFSSVTTD